MDYFVPLAVRMGCLFALGGLPHGVVLLFSEDFFSLLPSEIKYFFKTSLHAGGFSHLPAAGWAQRWCAHTRGMERAGKLVGKYPGAAGRSVCHPSVRVQGLCWEPDGEPGTAAASAVLVGSSLL